MGLAGYFRKFIPEFTTRTKLIKDNTLWYWGEEQNNSKKYVISHLSTLPLLKVFDPLLPTELHTRR